VLRRTTPSQMVQVRGVSDGSLPNGGSLLGILHNDHGKYSTEYLFSSDSALLGVRGLYNFGADPRPADDEQAVKLAPPPSLFSMGFEMYYGLLNKSGGMSTGLRFTTLPTYASFPYTMTLTLNPLMGNLSSTYAVKAGKYISLCSRFDFNFYSYESGVLVGCELWRLRRRTAAPQKIQGVVEEGPPGIETATRLGLDDAGPRRRSLIKNLSHGFPAQATNDDDVAGVLKARVDQDWKIGLLWEGRFKELLFTIGANLDLKRRERILAGLGVELQYSN
jgi:distribution and morphology protein 10